jgi:hypothetical protein
MQCVKSAKDERYGPYRLCYLPSIVEGRSPDAVITVVCAPDDEWSYNPKYVEQFTEI